MPSNRDFVPRDYTSTYNVLGYPAHHGVAKRATCGTAVSGFVGTGCLWWGEDFLSRSQMVLYEGRNILVYCAQRRSGQSVSQSGGGEHRSCKSLVHVRCGGLVCLLSSSGHRFSPTHTIVQHQGSYTTTSTTVSLLSTNLLPTAAGWIFTVWCEETRVLSSPPLGREGTALDDGAWAP